MNNYQTLFYWMTVADQAKIFFLIVAIISSIIGLVAFLISMGAFDNDKDQMKRARNWVFFSWPLWMIFWMSWIFTPDKKDALFIVAGGGAMNYLTQDSTAKQIPHELLEFTKVNLQNLAADAKVQLGVQNQRDKILEEAKSMTAEQLLDRAKIDSNFAKIILNK
jgi:hypothetical protein